MLDSGPAPTVTTPDFASDQTDLGLLKKNVYQSDGDWKPQVDTRTEEEKMRDAVAIQSGIKSDWGKVIGSAIPIVGGLFSDYVAGQREDTLRNVLESQAIDKAQIDEYLGNPDYKQELARAYNQGQFTGGNIPSQLLDVNETGSAIVYGIENLPDTLLKAVGLRDRVQDPFMTKVIGNPSYGTFTNFLAQQTPAFNVSNGMLSNVPVTPDMPNYVVDTGSGVTTSGYYDDSGDWSWSGTDFSAPSTTSDGNDWNSW
jgi:hypothetical protein